MSRGWEVIEHSCISTSTRFWLQKVQYGLSIDYGLIRKRHTVSLGKCNYFKFPSCGHDT